MSVKKSNELYRRAKRLIPGGGQTVSKRPEVFLAGKWPAYFSHGQGSHIWDIDGNEYIDYVMALGPIILGYCDPAVDEAIVGQVRKGTVASLSSPLEVELAEKIVQHVPCAEMVRFFKTGAESTQAAVRIARAYTGREKVISCGYHGWLDWCAAKKGERGVPKALAGLIRDVAYGDSQSLLEVLKRDSEEIACFILEPVVRQPDPEFLRLAREETERRGILLVFDEIITGFRLAMGGAQEYFGVIPDMATFGKAMANGMPIAALAGRKDVMKLAEKLWISSTFGGEALSLAASLATLKELQKRETLGTLWRIGARLLEGWKQLVQTNRVNAIIVGLPPIPMLRFLNESGERDTEAEGVFLGGMLEQGILWRRDHWAFVTTAHSSEDVEQTLDASSIAFEAVSKAFA